MKSAMGPHVENAQRLHMSPILNAMKQATYQAYEKACLPQANETVAV